MAKAGRAFFDSDRVSLADKRFGILCADTPGDGDRMLSALVGTLLAAGCLEQNIRIRRIPSVEEIPLGVLFFAEYTDVDVVAVPVFGSVDECIRKSVFDLQIQWNMPAIIDTDPERLVRRGAEMISLQEDMERESDELNSYDRTSVN